MFNKITENSHIGIISPAWTPNKKHLETGLKYLQCKGFKIKRGNHLSKSYGYFAGTDEDRLSDLHEMIADPEIDLIFCSRGGWGTLRLLDQIDYNLLKNNPKPIIGYSDITTLQLSIWHKIKIPSLSGPMVAIEMGRGISAFTEKHLWGQIQNIKPFYNFNLNNENVKIIRHGLAKGILLGGCLSLLVTLLGTPYCPDFKNTILFLEDIGEKPYKVDRYFAQLKHAGIFKNINALILGNFLDCEKDLKEKSFTISQIIDEYFSDADYPVLANFPYGHNFNIFTMPIGVQIMLNTESMDIIFENPFCD